MSTRDEDLKQATQNSTPAALGPLRDEFYMDGPYVVFTAAYHLRRGYCCNSDCRHCPYRDAPAELPGTGSEA